MSAPAASTTVVTAGEASAPRREVAYLVNLYPAPSHSFIRREIAALEALGWRVFRFSHRRADGPLPEAADRREREQTTVLRDAGWAGALRALLHAAWTRPGPTGSALAQAWRLSRGSADGVWVHLGHLGLACVLAQHLARLGGVHLHAHFGTGPAAVALLLHRLTGQPYSLTFHGPHEFEWPNRLHLAEKMAPATWVALVSEAGHGLLAERHPRLTHKLLRVPCGLHPTWLQALPTPVPQVARLVCVARLEPQKDPLRLLDAVRLLDQQGVAVELTVLGDGSLRAQMAQRVADWRLGHRVRLLGWASQAQVRRQLMAARALVLSSADEGLPVAVMEAFACGRPAIATRVGGVAELVEPGVTGWLVPPGDAAALAAAMAQALAASPEAMQALADTAWQRVQAHDVLVSARTLISAWSDAPVAVPGERPMGRVVEAAG